MIAVQPHTRLFLEAQLRDSNTLHTFRSTLPATHADGHSRSIVNLFDLEAFSHQVRADRYAAAMSNIEPRRHSSSNELLSGITDAEISDVNDALDDAQALSLADIEIARGPNRYPQVILMARHISATVISGC